METKKQYWQQHTLWSKALKSTFVCLLGCTIGSWGILAIAQSSNQMHENTLTLILLSMAGGLLSYIIGCPHFKGS